MQIKVNTHDIYVKIEPGDIDNLQDGKTVFTTMDAIRIHLKLSENMNEE